MTKNDVVLLDRVLESRAEDASFAPLEDDEAFELFACEQALKDRDLTLEEVEAGRTGGGDDGGIDGVFTFLNGDLVEEDSPPLQDHFEPSHIRPEPDLELCIVQAKRTQSFGETPFAKVSAALQDLLDLGKTAEEMSPVYDSHVIDRCDIFRRLWRTLAPRHPVTRIVFVYASKGSTGSINNKVRHRATALEKQLSELVSDANVSTLFLGARELLDLDARERTYTLDLTYTENATSSDSHVVLVRLEDYFDFISDEQGAIRKYIFDWNVRDYQGAVAVNKSIRVSLEDEASPDFWWLNNGVTVICSKASSTGKQLSLDDVQIVNGLQTSVTIYDFLSEAEDDDPAWDQSLLVRVIVTDDLPTRDAIIRATNRQTTVSDASLRATDQIQRDIEQYFVGHGLFYDRRKNYYKNQGKPQAKIISIPYLAQAVLAIGFSEANSARARPSSVLKKDADYERIFDPGVSLDVYRWIAEAQLAVDGYLKTAKTSSTERSNLRFYISMVAAARTIDQRVYNPAQLASAVDEALDEDVIKRALATTRRILKKFETKEDRTTDQIAKSKPFRDAVLKAAVPQSSSSKKQASPKKKPSKKVPRRARPRSRS